MHLSSFEIYDLNLQVKQLQDDLLSLKLDMKREAEEPFDLKKVDQHQEGNEDNFNLPPKFDEYEDGQEQIEEEEKGGSRREGC